MHTAGLRRDLVMLSQQLDDRRALLRRTWIFDFAGRRAHRAVIDELSGLIAGIHARALTLGLDDGWSRPAAPR